jgi:hypothetical protein
LRRSASPYFTRLTFEASSHIKSHFSVLWFETWVFLCETCQDIDFKGRFGVVVNCSLQISRNSHRQFHAKFHASRQNVLPEWPPGTPQVLNAILVCMQVNQPDSSNHAQGLHDTSPLPNIAYTYRFHCICKTEQPVSDLFTSFYQILSSMKVLPFAVIPVPEAS